jgi:hypothetical protein
MCEEADLCAKLRWRLRIFVGIINLKSKVYGKLFKGSINHWCHRLLMLSLGHSVIVHVACHIIHAFRAF